MSTTHNFKKPKSVGKLQPTVRAGEEEALAKKRRGVITERGTLAIANRITEVRKQRGISQQVMAKKLGITQPIISRYENGELRIHAELLAKFAKILETTSDDLLGLEHRKPVQPKNELDSPEKRKLWRKFQQIAKLPDKDQRAVIRLINSVAKAS